MSVSPASLMRRIYYVTILLALIAGGMYFAYSYRMGQASNAATGNVVGTKGTIAMPTDIPEDIPVYLAGTPVVSWSGFSIINGEKYFQLMYDLPSKGSPLATYDKAHAYYVRELTARGWTYKENEDPEHDIIIAENGTTQLQVFIGGEEGGVSIGIESHPDLFLGEQAFFDVTSTEPFPATFPSDVPVHPKARIGEYDLHYGINGGEGLYPSATLMVSASDATVQELLAFYDKEAPKSDWERYEHPSMAAMKADTKLSGEEAAFAAIARNTLTFRKEGNALNVIVMSRSFDSDDDSMKDVITVSIETRPESEYDRPRDKGNVDGNEAVFEPLDLPDFEDLPNGYGYAPAIKELKVKGVLKGYPDGTFKPGNPVNRAEFVKTIVEALGEEPAGDACFQDVKQEWYAKYACHAKEEGIIGGYPDGSFGPGRNVNYAEAVKIAMLAFGKMEEGDAEGWEWYDKYFNAALERGYLRLIESIAEDDPNTPISRGQMAQLIVNLSLGGSVTLPLDGTLISPSSSPMKPPSSNAVPGSGMADFISGREYTLEGTVMANMDPSKTQPDADISFSMDTLEYGVVKVYYGAVGDPLNLEINCMSDFFQLAYRLTPGWNVRVTGLAKSSKALSLCGSKSLSLTPAGMMSNTVAINRELMALISDCKPTTKSIPFSFGSKSLVIKGRSNGLCALGYTEEVEGGYAVYHCELPAAYDTSKGIIPTGDPKLCQKTKAGNIFLDQ